MNDQSWDIGRREILTAATGIATTALAGCLREPPDSDDGDDRTGSAAFFALKDWANQVAGDVMAFETPVEVGEMGHGWDPDGDIVPQIAQNDVFCYLRTPEFQWSIDIADELAGDGRDVTLIDGMQAIPESELLSLAGDGRRLAPPNRDVTFDPADFQVGEFELIHSQEVAAWWHDDHFHGGVPDVPLDGSIALSVHVEDTDGKVPPLGEDEPFQVDARISDSAPTGIVEISASGRQLEFQGVQAGETLVVFELRAGDEVVFDTANDPAMVTVAPPEAVEVDAFHDPHVWVDPIHAQSIVDLITDELATVVPDASETFRANAEDYKAQLARVDEAFEQLVADAALDVAVYVAHGAFQYVENRYGFELRTPVGVTPDAAESLDDIAQLGQTVENHGIDTILYDPFEAPVPDEDIPQGAAVLLEETSAEYALPLSAAEGTTPAWREEGYGWVEQMEAINLPSLRQALKAD